MDVPGYIMALAQGKYSEGVAISLDLRQGLPPPMRGCLQPGRDR
jgi:hypothetical protein